ncbi:putative F-box protein At2g02030 [Triticum aestivum]|uniref:putative F-box protein At2g02030 n=1 Tax=Triticum aestivum TaxID=4565 RepID=UPI001D02F48F|nr:putative F-box protein At2g02030 [Triticum aestivum]
MASPALQVPPMPGHGCHDPCLAAAATEDDDKNVSFLPDDVISEILSWLPAKSLCRTGCVSKKWRALISNPAFVAAHSSRAEPLLVAMTRASTGVLLQLMDTEGNVVRVGEARGWFRSFCLSYDGLACLTFSHKCSHNQLIDLAAAEKLMTCNTPAEFADGWIDRCTGVGRSAKTGAPKILGVVLESTITGLYHCVVLTAGEGAQWRPTQPPPYAISAVYDGYSEAVTFNGCVHFLSLDEDGVLVLCFDLETEQWKVIQGPPEVSSHAAGEKISMAELNGSVCVVQKTPNVVCMWLLTDPSGVTWIKAYAIQMGYTPIHFLMPLRMMHPSGRLLFCHYYDDSTMVPELQIYDPRSGGCTHVMNAPTKLIGKIRVCSSHIDPRF